jgi:hypothetical protein
MTMTDNQVPAQATSGQVVDTTEDGTVVPIPTFMNHGAPISDPGEALRNPYAADVNRLNNFLMEKFPQEMSRTNRPVRETPVDTAMRLLAGMATGGVFARCAAEYCNLPAEHDGDHGYVHYQAR